MIYTVGFREAYDTLFEGPNQTIKRGRQTVNGKMVYPGGMVFRTREDAQHYIDDNALGGYTVYGVRAEWGQDTMPSTEGPFHDLLKDAPMVQLIFVR